MILLGGAKYQSVLDQSETKLKCWFWKPVLEFLLPNPKNLDVAGNRFVIWDLTVWALVGFAQIDHVDIIFLPLMTTDEKLWYLIG